MLIVFSDLDGTILDHDTYSFEDSMEGISLLKKEDAPLILVSSKTFTEMQEIHSELGLDTPFIFENGGGIAFPDNPASGFTKEMCGKAVDELDQSFYLLEKFFGTETEKISDMSVDEVMQKTSLPEARARLARERETSIPFISPLQNNIDIDFINKINKELGGFGFSITKGGRFFHFTSVETGKGNALRKVKDKYSSPGRDIISAGIGDSENDIPMLLETDLPYIVRKKNSTAIKTGSGRIMITDKPGPAGFTEAVKKIIANLKGPNKPL